MLLLFSSRVAEWPPVWEELSIRFSVRVFRERLWISVCIFPFGVEDGMWYWIGLIPDHCLSTVDSRYLELEGTLWNTSRYPYFDISDFQNWGKYKSHNQI